MKKEIVGRYVYPDGDRLKNRRTSRPMTIEELAQVARCSPATIRKAEAGGRLFEGTLLRILRALQCAASFDMYHQKEKAIGGIEVPTKDFSKVEFMQMVPAGDVDECEYVEHLVKELVRVLGARNGVYIIAVRPANSFWLEAVMHVADILRWIAKLMEDDPEYARLDIRHFRVIETNWLEETTKYIAVATGDQRWANLAVLLNQDVLAALPAIAKVLRPT
jgi:transcriptional regulator with XRE-family HTH domain